MKSENSINEETLKKCLFLPWLWERRAKGEMRDKIRVRTRFTENCHHLLMWEKLLEQKALEKKK